MPDISVETAVPRIALGARYYGLSEQLDISIILELSDSYM